MFYKSLYSVGIINITLYQQREEIFYTKKTNTNTIYVKKT